MGIREKAETKEEKEMILVKYFEFMTNMGEWFLSWVDKDFTRKPFKKWGKK
jgi:hypothetical protein